MIAGLKSTICILLSSIVVMHVGAATETPIAKVVTLLKDLSTKVAAEGTKEAAQYDKFACFCKEQADEKQYAIEKSEEKVKHLKAERDELKSEEDLLNNEIVDLNAEIQALDKDINDKREARRKQHEDYLAQAKDMNEAIDSCGAAIDTLKNSKKDMRGAKLDLVQVTSGLRKVIKRQPTLATADTTDLLNQLKLDDQGAPKFEYHSNDIIATLQGLLETFNSMKRSLDMEAHSDKDAAEKVILGLANEKKFAQKAKDEKAAIAMDKQEQYSDRMEQIKEEVQDGTADYNFLHKLEGQCSEAAAAFDQRSQKRSEELSALNEATHTLATGAVENYKANKALVGLQKEAVGGFGKLASPATFVQISSAKHRASNDKDALDRISGYLAEKADKTDSGALSAIAERIVLLERHQDAGVDHFVKVRGLIEDLMKKLKADSDAEAEQKESCDKGIAQATHNRDAANGNIEKSTAKVTVLEANKNALTENNRELSAQISALQKGILESAELADMDVRGFSEQIDMLKAGTAAIDYALQILQNFYSPGSLVQSGAHAMSGSMDPPRPEFMADDHLRLLEERPAHLANADRDGKTIGDLAPSTATDTYHGAKEESSGIIGILEVIYSDFSRSGRQAQGDKSDTVMAQAAFETESRTDITAKSGKVSANSGKLANTEEELLAEEQSLKDAKGSLDRSLKVLEDLHATCVKGEETWEERAQKRLQEVEALKEALSILEDWQR